MARKRGGYDDDDGRTIADMSGVERPRLMGALFGGPPGRDGRRQSGPPREPDRDRPWEDKDSIPRDERRWYVLGALKAALLIGLAFVAGLGILVAVLLLVWGP